MLSGMQRNKSDGAKMTRRRPKGSMEDLLPDDRLTWARETWRDRKEVAKLDGGAWMLREAAKVLGY